MKKIILLVSCLTLLCFQQSYSQTDSTHLNNPEIDVAFGTRAKDKVVGAIDIISGADISKSARYNVNSAMSGLASGLGSGFRVRGRSRGGNGDSPLIVVDGIANRFLNSIAVEEIESVTILKDAVSKMLYGSKAANGVIIVKTKRGIQGKKQFNVSAEFGVNQPTVLPKYLNSADYARYYTQAEINDGKTTRTYTDEDIQKYQNGSSPIHHPNVDYYDTFLKKQTNYQRVTAQLIGGDENTQYFVNLGYIGEGGLEKVGDARQYDRLSVRSNLDYVVNDIITMNLDISGRMDSWTGPFISSADLFQSLSTHRPNDYPLFVSSTPNTDSLGYSSREDTNLYGELTRKGYKDQQNYYAQNNLGIDFDLSGITQGLAASAYLTFDISNAISTGKELTYSRIRVDKNTDGTETMVRVGEDDLKGSQEKFDDNFNRNFGAVAKLDYNNTFGKHAITSNLAYVQQRLAEKTGISGKAVGQDDKSINLGISLNYAYDNKYIVEGTSSYMGSDKFTPEQRWKLYGAGGLGWVISKENFLQSVSFINYLKLKASYGVMGYDRNYDYLLDRNEYTGGGRHNFGYNNSVAAYGQRMSQLGNSLLTFEEAEELNVGIEGVLFNNALTIEANYFSEMRTGIPISSINVLPGYMIGTVSAPMVNYNEISNEGIEVSLSYTNSLGNLNYTIGGNLTSFIAQHEVYSENAQYNHLARTGKATDAIFGFVAEGLYTSQAEIDAHGVTSSYATLMPGDIRYKDITNDLDNNLIDSFDAKEIGNTVPRVQYAFNLNLNYKGISLYALGQGYTGFNRLKRNTYYWNYGQRKYSTQVIGSAVPTDAPTEIAKATSPRLTTENGGHSYKTSTYWMEDGAFFKLRVLQLSYQLPTNLSKKIAASKIKLFARGSDLFTISKNKDIEPESINAGITNNPRYKTVSLGINLTF